MIILKTSDFVGFFEISQSTADTVKLQTFINQFEKSTLYDLLGQPLADLYIADLVAGVPVTDRFKDIHNAFTKSHRGVPIISQGIRFILTCVLFYHYISNTKIRASESGTQINETEVSVTLSPRANLAYAEDKYSKALPSWDAIRRLIIENKAIYPEYCDSSGNYLGKKSQVKADSFWG